MAKKINMMVLKSQQLKAEIAELESKRKSVNEILIKEMQREHIKSVKTKNVNASLVTKISLVFDKFKLKENLPTNVYNKIIDKTYYVSDNKAFKSLMKEYGVPSKALRECMIVREDVNQDRIDQLTESKKITKKMLKGTYEKKISSYIKLVDTE